MPATGELEARVRNTSGGTATIYKAGVYLRLVNIVKAKSIQRIAAAKAGMVAADDFVGQRVRSYSADFGTATKSERVECRAKSTNGVGVGSFQMKDAAAATTSGNSSLSNVGTTLNYSADASFRSIENTIVTTNGRQNFMSFTRTSGGIDLSHCIYSTNTSY